MKTVLIIILAIPILIALLVVNWHFPKVTSEHRKPNKYDLFYEYLAINNNRPDFCERISPLAYSVAPFNSNKGTRVSLYKSECYKALAINTENATYCDKVLPINTWIYSGQDNNAQNCRREIAQSSKLPGKVTVSGYSPIEEEKKVFLKEMGIDYTADPQYQKTLEKIKIDTELFNRDHPETPDSTSPSILEREAFQDYFYNLEKTNFFLEKAKQLPLSN